MTAILLILVAASIGHGLAKALKLPHVPLLILSGGALDYLNLPIQPTLAKDGLLLGLIFLVFLSGTALNPWRTGVRRFFAILLGAAQFFVLGLVTLLFCLALDFSFIEAVYLSLAMASSSTLVVIKILQLRGELFEPFGRLMVGALLVQDVLMMLVIAGLSNLEKGAIEAVSSGALALALGLLGLVFKKWVIPWLLLSKKVDEELQLLLALGILFFFMAVAYWFNLPFIAGAFVAGISLSAFPVNGVLKGQFASLNNFFTAVFFVTLGFFVDFPPVESLGSVAILSALVLALTPLVTALVALAAGMTLRIGSEAGLLLAQTSEFSIVLALIGMENRDLGQGHLSLITSITVVTMILTPFLSNEKAASLLMRFISAFSPKIANFKKLSGHYVLIGCGESAMVVLKKLLASGEDVVVIDDDAGVVNNTRELGAISILGNGKDPAVLRHGCLRNAKLVISSMRKASDNKVFLSMAPDVPKVIRVFDEDEASGFEQFGAIPIPATDAAGADLVAWAQKNLKKILDNPS